MTYSSAVPVLPSLDIQKSCDFFVENLGFDPHFVWTEDLKEGEAPPYGGVQKGDVHIHFITVQDKMVCEWTVCRVYVTNIEEHYKRAQEKGIVHPNGPLKEQPWGERDFGVLDAHGVLIYLAEELS